MCGIYCILNFNNSTHVHDVCFSTSQKYLKRRGPDGFCEHSVCSGKTWSANLACGILWLQGPEPILQPVIDRKNNALLWNGDVLKGPLETDSSDTLKVSQSFSENENILKVISNIQGPFSFIYIDVEQEHLYFGRDRLGRHSLLWSYDDERGLTLSSVAKRNVLDFREVPSIGIFRIDMNVDGPGRGVVFPWSDIPADIISKHHELFPLSVEISTNPIKSPITQSHEVNSIEEGHLLSLTGNDILEELQTSAMQELVDKLLHLLRESVAVRVLKQPSMCKNCINNSSTAPANGKFQNCPHSKLGVMFSGGLDSTILAALAHEFVPPSDPIDLLNVAFECFEKKVSRKCKRVPVSKKDKYSVPDRITGRNGVEHLRRMFPEREWKFVEIDISQEELKAQRDEIISDLISPLNTVLDDSLGCALWFGSRGEGWIESPPGSRMQYNSPARVLLLGMGADELFGGYMRHRTTLKKSGWAGLAEELKLDFTRISERNLGRDDRVVSDHGRQGRFPFLDEAVVSFACSLQPWERCYPTDEFPQGVGDKLLLRLAGWKLGLHYAATLPKRAFQFGSKIANSKENGNDISARLVRENSENVE